MTVSYSGVTVGSSMIAVIAGTFQHQGNNGSISITPTGSGNTRDHSVAVGGFAYNKTAYSNCVSATATSSSGSLGFTIGRTYSNGVTIQAACSLLTFKA